MHKSSMDHMRSLVAEYLSADESLSVMDLGSYDVNGSYRELFDNPRWSYTGLDASDGPGVDVVLKDPYKFPFGRNTFNVAVSGQAFEHVNYFWLTFMEIMRVLKKGGVFFLIAPSRGPEHRFPQDCWRFYPDGYRALAAYGGCELLQVSTDWDPHPDPDSSHWGDTVGVFRKPHTSSLSKTVGQTLCRLGDKLTAPQGAR